MTDYFDLLSDLEATARRAGEAILAIYRTDFEVERKADYSPVTQADLDAEAIILDVLRRLTPEIPVVAEEESSTGGLPDVGDVFWLVDPLDGTREFMNRNGEFTVNIALIENRHPVLGVVHAPERSLTFTGSVRDGATRQAGDDPAKKITVRTPPPEGLTVVSSRRHGSASENEKFLNGRTVADRVTCGSSLKFCVVASGEADLYPRFGPTMEWDTAAGHAVLAAAGGCLTTPDGGAFLYRKPDFRNSNFIAWGGLRPD
jgi:3'(2'), 5'-bisphosphate nucleotidase